MGRPKREGGRATIVVATGLLVATLFGAGCAAAEEPRVTADVSPREIRPGETARLTVRISGARSAGAPVLPPIDGLEPGGRSQQTSFSIVNGSMSSEVVYSWSLLAMRGGDFAIPPLEVEVGGRRLSTEPLLLRVVAAGLPARNAPGAAGGAGHPAGGAGSNAPGGAASADRGGEEPPAIAALEIHVPDRELFVGESVPGTLRLVIRDGVRVTDVDQPQVVGDAFTVTRPTDRQPDQTTTTIGGRVYHLVSFPVAISPIRPGVHDLAASTAIHAILPRGRDRRRDADEDDPFSNSFFGGLIGESRKLDVRARPLVLRVLPLPEAGRPADFSGAIGRFTISGAAEPRSISLGDPITQRVTVQGEGNLDRVDLPALVADRDWRIYPGSSRIETTDPLGVRGAKIFEQAIVPQRTDLAALPVRRLSYFDPAERRYATIATQPIAIAVAAASGGPAGAAAGSPGSGATSAAPAASGGVPPGGANPAQPAAAVNPAGEDELAPNEIASGATLRRFTPLVRQPGWLARHLLPLLAALLAFAWARHAERRRIDPLLRREREARRRAAERAAEMAGARQSGEAGAFFAAARHAVQESVARRGDTPPAALDADAIAALLERAGDGDASLAREVRELFAAADAATYAGGRADPGLVGTWQVRVDALLRELEGRT
jgi:BatD DUF11 like domain